MPPTLDVALLCSSREGFDMGLECELVEELQSFSKYLTLVDITKPGTDLGTLVVPFDQTFHPLHSYTHHLI